jgi:thiamine biosynthesis lipoprotein
MTTIDPTPAYERVGDERLRFGCCDTTFVIQSAGVRAGAAARAARRTARRLEARLDAFDDASAVSELNRGGVVDDAHLATVVRRGLEYYDRTDGVFDVHQGAVEHDLKAYLRGETDSLPERFETGTVRIDGDRIATETPLDLNGLAKGYVVDRAAAALAGFGRRGFVSGGGDTSPPTGPVAVESPYGDEKPLRVLDTDWAVATSGNYRRRRGGVDHVYDPTADHLGARHESVTVLARRDCMEADALATTLSALPLDAALDLAEDWAGLEAFVVHDGVFHETGGFDEHVLDH